MCRYGNLEYLFKLPFKRGFELIIKILEKDYEEQKYKVYIDLEKFKVIEYKDFEKQLDDKLKNKVKTSEDEVLDTLKEVEKILDLGGVF